MDNRLPKTLPPNLSRVLCFEIADPLYLFVFTQFRTENRFTLFLELLSCRTQETRTVSLSFAPRAASAA